VSTRTPVLIREHVVPKMSSHGELASVEDTMAITLTTNLASLSAQRSLSLSQGKTEQTLRNISSGYRVNNAADDAAGLAVSEKLRATARSMRMAERNASDAIGLIQTAEGAMSEVGDILLRARELAMQAATETVGFPERDFIQQEISQMFAEVDRMSASTEFNGRKMLDGSGSFTFQVGTQDSFYDRLQLNVSDMSGFAIGVSGVNVATVTGARSALQDIDDAIQYVSEGRAELGAMSNRLETTINHLNTGRENTEAARSRIVDADIAYESAQLTKNQLMMNANVSVMAQANQAPSIALSLLG